MMIRDATSSRDMDVCRRLFEEYASWLRVDLCFQGFAKELESLPGAYAPPQGRLLLVTVDELDAGCCALRPIDATTCEMKRLFVREEHRGGGIGRALAERIVSEARLIGYRKMKLDTLSRMEPAITLYESLGFVRCGSYYDTPLRDTVFMQMEL